MVGDLRREIRADQARELKFAQFSGHKRIAALGELFGPGGPLEGRVNIVVGEKRFMVAGKMVDLLIEEWAHDHSIDIYSDGSARRMARNFFADGPRGLRELWEPLLAAFVSLARATQRSGTKEDVDSFFRRLDEARWNCHRRSVEELLKLLLETRKYAEDLVRCDSAAPALDPLGALIPLSIQHWHQRLGAVRMLHDNLALLTKPFVHDMLNSIWNLHPDFVHIVRKSRVAEFSVGESKAHASIQLADLAAGAGREVTKAFLTGWSPAGKMLDQAVRPLITWGVLPDDSLWETEQN